MYICTMYQETKSRVMDLNWILSGFSESPENVGHNINMTVIALQMN